MESGGFAKILVPDHELDRALSQNSSSHDHKFHGVAKWHDAKAPSSRAYRSAQVSATSVGCRKMSSATIASGAEFFMREKWKQMASKGPSRSHAQGLQSFRDQRYSNIASEKTAEIRINSALRDMRWLLERLKLPSNSRGRSAFNW